jgi:hypothetical protein
MPINTLTATSLDISSPYIQYGGRAVIVPAFGGLIVNSPQLGVGKRILPPSFAPLSPIIGTPILGRGYPSLHWPADLVPPDWCMGTLKLRQGFAGVLGSCVADGTSTPAANLTFNNNIIDPAIVDAARGGNLPCRQMTGYDLETPYAIRVNFMNDQIGGIALGAPYDRAPRMCHNEVAGVRALLFEGGQNYLGKMQWLAGDLSTFNLNAASPHTVMLVMKPSSSLPRQVKAVTNPAVHTIFELCKADNTTVTRLIIDGIDSPGYHVQAQDFDINTKIDADTAPSVITVIRNGNEVSFRQNGRMRVFTQSSNVTGQIASLYFGRKSTSAEPVSPAYLPTNEAGQYWLWAALIWKRALSDRECRLLERSFDQRLPGRGIGLTSRHKYCLFTYGHSIAAEYNAPGLNGWFCRLLAKMPVPVCGYQYAVAGAPETPQAYYVPWYHYSSGYFNEAGIRIAKTHPRALLIADSAGANDTTLTTPALCAASAKLNCDRWIAAGGMKPLMMGQAPLAGSYNYDIFRRALNPILAANAGNSYTYISDFERDPYFQNPPNDYQVDGAHWEGSTGGERAANLMLPHVIKAFNF